MKVSASERLDAYVCLRVCIYALMSALSAMSMSVLSQSLACDVIHIISVYGLRTCLEHLFSSCLDTWSLCFCPFSLCLGT